MPVKNAGHYLKDCLNSILQQTEKDWELLAINDHSTDNSLQILQSFAQTDARIRVFNNLGSGIIPALRLAFENAKGSLITRMDADDLMPLKKLELLKQQLLQAGPGHLSSGLVQYFSEGRLGEGYQHYQDWLNQLLRSGRSYEAIYRECVIPSPCWMVFREDLIRCGAFEADRYPEDYDLCFRFYEQQLHIISAHEVLHLWRDHPSRSSRNDPNYADNRFLELKLDYFLRLDHELDRPLIIWGAGKKGKKLAAMLAQRAIPFHWVTNNTRKIGHQISGVLLQPEASILDHDHPQLLIAIAAPDQQSEIRQFLSRNLLQVQKHYFFFC